MGQYCFTRWRLSSVVVYNAAGGQAGRPPGAWEVGGPTLHGGPVRLRPVRATPCSSVGEEAWSWKRKMLVQLPEGEGEETS